MLQILPFLVELRDSEKLFRDKLKELGITAFEKLNICKKRKSKAAFVDDEVYECDVCRKNLFVSLVSFVLIWSFAKSKVCISIKFFIF